MAKASKDKPSVDEWREAFDLLEGVPDAALAKFEASAERGDRRSMISLGESYLSGRDGRADAELGERWLRRAAEGGSIEAGFRLAHLYASQDEYPKAIAEWHKLSERGYPPAMYRLGRAYYGGLGVEKDLDRGLKYLTVAEAKGHLLAKQMVIWHRRTHAAGIVSKFFGDISLIIFIFQLALYRIRHPRGPRLRGWA